MTKQYGLTLSGNIRVFRKDKEITGNGKKTFTIQDVWFNVSEKEDDGGYINKSCNLLFGRDVEKPQNNTIIHIKEAFPVLTGTGKWQRIAYFVKEFETHDMA